MDKGRNSNPKTTILLVGVVVCMLALLAAVGFMYGDLGHKLELMTYKKIRSAEDLKAISQNPSGKYCLASDVDMDGVEWEPFTFTGTLDGDGHEIKNLTVSETGSAVRDTYDGNWKPYQTKFAGLFDVIEGATVRNLTLSSVYVGIKTDEPCFVGSLAGYMSDSTITDCKVTGDVYLRAHDRMFGAGGVVGFGKGLFERVRSDVTMVVIDTDRTTKDEQFMGGLVGAGYPDVMNCTVNIDGYGSEHGYAHNGGMIGLYTFYPKGTKHPGKMAGNRIYGKITFFEENDDRRAYCKALIGELLEEFALFEDNGAEFRAIEVFNYDADLLPEERSEVFEFDVAEKGRFELAADYKNEGADCTYGLFINDRFYKKVSFPKGEGQVKETVYLDAGKAKIKFRFLPGDGNVSFKDVKISKSSKKVTLIVAPHQDDEILGFAGTIQKTLKEGNEVKVLFLTTGDYFGTDYTAIRLKESVNALKVLGVDKQDITYLGYGDLTLKALLTAEDPNQVFGAKSGKHGTYADPSQNIFDYHSLNTGDQAQYCGGSLREDFRNYVLACRPDRVFTTSEFEWHTDHEYAFRLVKDTLTALNKEIGYHPQLLETVIHGEEKTWPEVLTYGPDNKVIIKEFTNPFPKQQTTLDWSKAIKITLTDEEIDKKMKAIGEFPSQNDGGKDYPGTKDYTYAFCKRDEFWWEIDY